MHTMNQMESSVVLLAFLFGFVFCFTLGFWAGADLLSMVFRGFVGAISLGIVSKLFSAYIVSILHISKENSIPFEEID